MNKLLKNPIVVSVLAVFAVGFALRGPISSLFVKKKNDSQQTAAAEAEAEAEEEPTKIEFASIKWDANSGRNPFRPSKALNAVAALDPGSGPGNSALFARRKLTLSAVWIQNSGRWAVLNDRILSEGESVDGFRVVAISSDAVEVSGPGGRERIPFGSTPRSALTGVQVEEPVPANEGRSPVENPNEAILNHPLISPFLNPGQP